MPRSNRPRGRRRVSASDEDEYTPQLSRSRRVETRRGIDWVVQEIAATNTGREFTCPGCGVTIRAETAHVVAWRTDGIMGEAHDVAARRHWHSHCWRIG